MKFSNKFYFANNKKQWSVHYLSSTIKRGFRELRGKKNVLEYKQRIISKTGVFNIL